MGKSGRYLIRIQPAVDIWEPAGAERFVSEVRSVHPEVTGPPVTSFEAIRLIRRGYYEGTIYALVMVTIVTGVFSGLSALMSTQTNLPVLSVGSG